MAEALIAEIDATIASNKIVVYSKTYCPHAGATKQLFSSKGVEFKCIELDQVPNGGDIQNALQQKTGQRTVPNVFIGGDHIGGNSDVQQLNSSGQLDAKIAA